MVSPAEFIPVAEESGLIVPLGAFMLDEACRSLPTGVARSPAASGSTCRSTSRRGRCARATSSTSSPRRSLRHGLPGDALWLEITESVMMEDSISTAGVMAGLRSLGVRLSVDDFGTGFSSLSYAQAVPGVGRQDRPLVRVRPRPPQSDSSLVAAIIAMASALGLDTIAEGVETDDQASRLLDLGCTAGTGQPVRDPCRSTRSRRRSPGSALPGTRAPTPACR